MMKPRMRPARPEPSAAVQKNAGLCVLEVYPLCLCMLHALTVSLH